MKIFAAAVAGCVILSAVVDGQGPVQSASSASAPADLKLPTRWEYTAPLIAPEKRAAEPSRAQKDPTIVYHEGKWHVFMTVKLPGRSAIE